MSNQMASNIKHVNHELSPMACPVHVDDVDLFGVGAQEHWYEAFAVTHSLMTASMVTLRPTQELYFQHRRELTDPWVGVGALRHREMITRHANELVDEWIDDEEVEFIGRFARPLPQRVVAEIMGFPQADVPLLAEWGDAVVTPFVYGTGLTHELTADQ